MWHPRALDLQLYERLAYFSNLNPIEEAFSKIKRLVRKAEAKTQGALIEAIGSALSAVSSGDAYRFIDNCGYCMPVQSLR